MNEPDPDVHDAKKTPPVDVVGAVEALDVYPTYDTVCKCLTPDIFF